MADGTSLSQVATQNEERVKEEPRRRRDNHAFTLCREARWRVAGVRLWQKRRHMIVSLISEFRQPTPASQPHD